MILEPSILRCFHSLLVSGRVSCAGFQQLAAADLSCVVMSRTAPSTKSTAVNRLSTVGSVDSVSLTHSWPPRVWHEWSWYMNDLYMRSLYSMSIYVLQNNVKMQILIRRHLNTTGTTGTTKDSCAHMTCAAHMTSSTDHNVSCRFFQLMKTESNKHRR